MALASLAKQDALRASISEDGTDNPIAAKQPHFLPKAKNIIYLFMAGGPSQLELLQATFDAKKHIASRLIPRSTTNQLRCNKDQLQPCSPAPREP